MCTGPRNWCCAAAEEPLHKASCWKGSATSSIPCLAPQTARCTHCVIRCAPLRRAIHAHCCSYMEKCGTKTKQTVESSLKWFLHNAASHHHTTVWSKTAQLHDPTVAVIDALGGFATKSLRQECIPTCFNCISRSHLFMQDYTPAICVSLACGFQKRYI